MAVINRILSTAAERQDILLIIFLALVVFMIIIPLPTWLIDGMITLNFMLALLILMVGLYLSSAADFTTLPAIILMTTLFRLAISISTTRLILLNADAGKIVETFGQFVVGGSLVVGIIIFLIITVVQFVVITKGAERVAEVGARFSLDAMPGKQMAIDSDVRSGELTLDGARDARSRIQTESQFYGAMDGTMKFVKGDSIAGIIIILVNLVGGMAMGVLDQGLSFGESATIYTILTVGDGLVSQIPALIIAISAGSIVTRVSSSKPVDLGNEIAAQLSANTNSLRFTALLLFLFGLIPGFPTLTFMGASAAVVGISFLVARSQKRRKEVDASLEQAAVEEETLSSSIQIWTGSAIHEVIETETFQQAAMRERKVLLANLGVAFPGYAINKSDAHPHEVELRLERTSVAKIRFPDMPNVVLALDTAQNLEVLGAKPLSFDLPWETEACAWLGHEDGTRVLKEGVPVLTLEDVLARMTSYALPRHIDYFLGIQETRMLLTKASRKYPDLVEEALEQCKLAPISEILQDLVRENVSIRDMRSVLEGIVKWAPKEKDPEMLVEYVRSYMSKQISAQVSPDTRTIYGVIFSPETEDLLRDSTQVTNVGSYLALSGENRQKIIKAVKAKLDELRASEGSPTLITSMDIRRVLRKFMWTNQLYLPVISQQDIAPEYRVQLVGEVSV